MKNIQLLLFLLFLPFFSFSQRYLELLQEERINFFEVQREAEKYFENRDQGRGSGYKQWKRWEYLHRKDLDDQGYVISDQANYQEMMAYQEANAGSPESVGGDWRSLGPSSWNRTSGWNPGVGRIVCIAVEPTAQQLIYVGTNSTSGSLWKSTDGGGSWRVLTDDFPSVMVVWSVSIDPHDTSKVYMGTTGGGVMRSNDGGNSWTTLPGPNGNIRRILVSSQDTGLVFAGSNTGIWRSTNSGNTWTKTHFSAVEDMEFKPGNENVIHATGTFYYRSNNNGLSFSNIPVNGTNNQRMKLAVTPADTNYVYIIQRSGSIFGSLFKSVNGGNTFDTTITYRGPNTGTNFLGYSTTGNDQSGQAWRDMAICVNPVNKNEVHIAGIACWKSLNGGTSFTVETAWFLPNSIGYNHADVEVLQFLGGTIYAGTDGGIYKSIDFGDNWIDLTTGIENRQFYRIGCSQLDSNVVTGGSQDNGTSVMRTTNRSWDDWLGADGMETFADHSNVLTLYGTSQFGSMYKSTNQGGSRTSISKPSGVGNGSWVTPFEQDPGVSSTIYVGFDEIYKNTTGGSGGPSGWTAISNLNFSNLDEIALAPSDNQTIYVADGASVYRTTNGGTSWTNVSSGVTGFVNYISVDPNDPQRVALAVSGSAKVLLSTNGGTNWTGIGSSIPSSVYCVLIDHTADNGIYAGNNGGVYYRNDANTTWAPFMSGLPTVRVYELEIQLQSQKIRAATYGRGLWESPIYNAGNSAPFVNFNGDKTDAVVGDTVFFTDVSAGSPTSWNWDFQGGNPATSTQQNPFVIYSSAGTYDVKLTATNAFGADSAIKSGYITVRPYCLSEANTSIDSYINNFSLSNVNNTTTSCATYEDHTNLVANVFRDSTYTVSVTTADCDGGNTYPKGFNVYIDWDANNEFDEITERVFSSPIQGSGTFTSNITVPQSAILGITGLRVVCSETAPISACGTYDWGETEDYRIQVKDTTAACPTVSIDPQTKDYVSCDADSIISLTGGSPIGGVYTGSHVTAGNFDMQLAGVGVHKYYYTFDDGQGCAGIDSGTVTISEYPVFSISADGVNPNGSDSLFACPANPANPVVNLFYLVNNAGNLTSPIQGSWTPRSGGTIIGSGSPVTYVPVPDSAVSRVSLNVTDGNGCSSTKDFWIITDQYPDVTPDFDKSQACLGETVTLKLENLPNRTFSNSIFRISPTPGVVYISSGPEILDSVSFAVGNSMTNPIPSISNPTWFVYEWSFSEGGCASLRRDSVLVNSTPTVTFAPLNDICINDAPSTISGGQPNFGVYSGPGVSNGIFDPATAGLGTHIITYTFGSANCQDFDTSSITVYDAPDISLSADGVNPVGSDSLFACLSNPQNPLVDLYYLVNNPGNLTAPIQAIWTPLSGGSIAGTSNPVTFIPHPDSTVSRVSLSVNDGNSCLSQRVFWIITDLYPAVSPDFNMTQACLGETVTMELANRPNTAFTNSIVRKSPTQGLVYSSSGPEIRDTVSFIPGSSITNPISSLSTPTWFVYEWTFTDAGNCAAIRIDSILVNPTPTVTLASFNDICINESPQLLVGGQPNFGVYSGTGVTNGSFDPTVAGLGTHTITYTFGPPNCQDFATSTITVNPAPVVMHPDLPGLCEGDDPIIISGGSPVGGTYSGPGITGNQFDPVTVGVGLHVITYAYSDSNNCAESVDFDIPVFQGSKAGFSFSNSNLTVSFTDTSQNAMSWSWDFGDGSMSTGQNPFHTYAVEGTYRVCQEVQSFEGCPDSICQDVDVRILDLGDEFSGGTIAVYPNPFGNELVISPDFDHRGIECKVFDALGKMVLEFSVSEGQREVHVPTTQLAAGTYFLRMDSEGERVSIPIQKN